VSAASGVRTVRLLADALRAHTHRPASEPAAAPGDECGRAEADHQTDDAERERPARLRSQRSAGQAQRADERADADERRRHAERLLNGFYPHARHYPAP